MKIFPSSFQQLTAEDKAIYGDPDLIYLDPPIVGNPLCLEKRNNWIEWRAAPYQVQRHSEYLYLPKIDSDIMPKILISAVLKTPSSIEEYMCHISKKRRYDILGKKASKLGYSAAIINPKSESEGIWDVIHSCDTRQGRKIASQFNDRPANYSFPSYVSYGDPNYEDVCCGVFSASGKLVAYLLGKRVGDHVQYDEIMGHADHLSNDVMYLLHIFFLNACIELSVPPKFLNYGPWYSGIDPYSPQGGLNRWKRKTKFRPAYLIFASS